MQLRRSSSCSATDIRPAIRPVAEHPPNISMMGFMVCSPLPIIRGGRCLEAKQLQGPIEGATLRGRTLDSAVRHAHGNLHRGVSCGPGDRIETSSRVAFILPLPMPPAARGSSVVMGDKSLVDERQDASAEHVDFPQDHRHAPLDVIKRSSRSKAGMDRSWAGIRAIMPRPSRPRAAPGAARHQHGHVEAVCDPGTRIAAFAKVGDFSRTSWLVRHNSVIHRRGAGRPSWGSCGGLLVQSHRRGSIN